MSSMRYPVQTNNLVLYIDHSPHASRDSRKRDKYPLI